MIYDMDKPAELELFHYIYGRGKDWDVISFESPDFLCNRDSSTVLGVEVTELWHNESDARLKNLEGYAFDLLDSGKYRHKDDKSNIKVDVVKYMPKGEEDKAKEINAIIHEMPGFKERVSLLEGAIKSKEDKASAYMRTCPVVDLIIEDASSLFWFEKYENIFHPISGFVNRSSVINSPFREIFVITKTKENKKVYISLKLNLFAEDIAIFEKFVVDSEHFHDSEEIARAFKVILYCLRSSSYGNLRTHTEDNGFGIIVGCHLYLYTGNGKHIRDYSTMPERLVPGDRIKDILCNVGETELKIANEFLEERKKCRAHMPLYFEVKSI